MSPENPRTPEINGQAPSPSTDKAKSPGPPIEKEVKKEEVNVQQEVKPLKQEVKEVRQEPEGQLTVTSIREEPKVPVVGTTSVASRCIRIIFIQKVD